MDLSVSKVSGTRTPPGGTPLCRIRAVAWCCVLLGTVITACACSRQTWSDALRAAAAGASGTPTSARVLFLFGGTGHKTFLGCLNCRDTSSDSVLNSFGPYGSPYATDSIFNHYGEFGSAYSNSSACDPYATDPPVIVGPDGTFYGRLTLNPYNTELGVGGSLTKWLKAVCAD